MGNTDLPTAVMLLKTSPLWVAVLSPWIVKEVPGRRVWIALGVGLIGCGLRFGFSGAGEEAGVLLSLLSGLLAALAYLALRALSRTDDPLTVVVVFSGFLTLAPLPFMGDALQSYTGWSPKVWLLLAAIGISGTVGQLALTGAYRAGSAAAVTIAGLSEIAMAMGYSLGVFGEAPTVAAFAGGLLAVGAGLLATWKKNAKETGATAGPTDASAVPSSSP